MVVEDLNPRPLSGRVNEAFPPTRPSGSQLLDRQSRQFTRMNYCDYVCKFSRRRAVTWSRSLGVSVAFVLVLGAAYGDPSYGRDMGRSTTSKIDSAVQTFIDGGYGPGVSIAVMRAGKVMFVKAYGMANLETETRVTPDTVFRAGSITKQFTAACIMRLVQEGRLSLDDPVSKYLPELAPAGPVTVRMLLTHTSGLHPYTDKPFQKEVRQPHTTQQMVDYIASQRPLLDFNPGTKYRYSTRTSTCWARSSSG